MHVYNYVYVGIIYLNNNNNITDIIPIAVHVGEVLRRLTSKCVCYI